ncbi:hypothetical protein [Faecalibacter macacae]|nr:hypothetical protein [Faecalibacter macacae]
MSFILNSCSVSTPFFIQNISEKDVEIKIVYNYEIKELDKFGDFKIVYQNGILNQKEFDKSTELINIEQKQLNDSTLQIYIPKNSTARIARTGNTYFINKIKSISYDNKDLSIEEVLKKSSSKNWKITYKIE